LNSGRRFTDVRAIAWGYGLALEKGRSGEAYNLGSGREVPVQDIFDLVFREAYITWRDWARHRSERCGFVPLSSNRYPALRIHIHCTYPLCLRMGQFVVMNNLSSHKVQRVRQLIEEHGCQLLHLPPNSPEFNPIKVAFAKVKTLLVRAAPRSREALVEAMDAALEAITAQETHGFFGHCGDSSPFQPL
jgi:hypothetical protein